MALFELEMTETNKTFSEKNQTNKSNIIKLVKMCYTINKAKQIFQQL